jgi:hypothetical protein
MPEVYSPAPVAPGTLTNGKEDLKATLVRLKDLTRRTGILHEAQVVQLEHWPHVLFNISEHETGVDSDQRVITFVLAIKGKASKENHKHSKRLEAWVWSLLGDEWMTKVFATYGKTKGLKKIVVKPVYSGSRKAPFEPPPPPGADFKRYDLKDKKAAFEVAGEPLPPLKMGKEKT